MPQCFGSVQDGFGAGGAGLHQKQVAKHQHNQAHRAGGCGAAGVLHPEQVGAEGRGSQQPALQQAVQQQAGRYQCLP